MTHPLKSAILMSRASRSVVRLLRESDLRRRESDSRDVASLSLATSRESRYSYFRASIANVHSTFIDCNQDHRIC